MADTVWGLLAKSAVDPSTIETAVASMIAAHNADPTAHLGSGQSLQSHKSNSIIDHLAGSVLTDKWTMSEEDYTTLFENLAVFGKHGMVTNIFPGVQINPSGNGVTNYGGVWVDLESNQKTFDTSKESLFQFVFIQDSYQHGYSVLKMGWNTAQFVEAGMGLEINNGVARFFVGDEAATHVNYLSFPAYSDVQTYVIRMHSTPSDGRVHIYVNGVELGSLAWYNPAQSDPAYIRFDIQHSSGSTPFLNVNSLFFSMAT